MTKKKIPDNLFESYMKWVNLNGEASKQHGILQGLMTKHLSTKDPLEHGKLIVEMGRKRIDLEDGESSNGKTTASDTVNEGSTPSSPAKRIVQPSPKAGTVSRAKVKKAVQSVR